MFIKRLTIENFKSFHTNQNLVARKKNMIIGKNGSGKSNLLVALGTLFLYGDERRPQYNNNERPSVIEVEVDNTDRRFLLPATFVLQATFKDGPEFSVNGKAISQDELRGLLDNAGFTPECFVMQGKVNGIAMMNEKERFRMISRIAGVEKYEDSKKAAISLLNEESEDKIEALIEKIEMKMKITEEYKRKTEEHERLTRAKAEAEFELLNYELKELNQEIDSMSVGCPVAPENDEGMVEFEIKGCKEEIERLAMKISEAEEFTRKFDEGIVRQITEAMEAAGRGHRDVAGHAADKAMQGHREGANPYDQKVATLEKAHNELTEKLRDEERREREKYIELKALKFLSTNVKNEDVGLLEGQLRAKQQEISSFDKANQKENYRTLISRRKELWNREKMMKDELKAVDENEKSCENKILYMGKLSINIYDAIKSYGSKNSGVVGTVFSLFDIPDDLLDAFEAVTRNSLFWIVVETEDVATRLISTIEGRATFVALNRVAAQSKQRVRDGRLYRLADRIECDQKYRNLLEMICRDYYVTDSPGQALETTEKHRVNVVTLEGDIFSKSGSITGGYEGSNQTLRELKRYKRRRDELTGGLEAIATEIADISERIRYSELAGEDELRILDNLCAIERYLQLKIELVKKKTVSVPEISTVEMELGIAQDRIPKLRLEVEAVEGQLSRASEKKRKIDEVIERIETVEFSKGELERIRAREKQLVDMLYMRKANDNIEESARMQRKHLLIDRRTQLMRKIGTTDFRAVFASHSKEEVMERLKEVNRKLKPYAGFAKLEIFDDQRLEMRERLEELRHSKAKILEFISSLDRKKEETFNLSFSMISENFTFFFRRFTGRTATLRLGNGTVEILLDGSVCDISSLSGGQKTVVALSVIFAIQKNDPSPFYVFDEIDANLDQEHSQRLCEIIRESEAQYFICSFKREMIESCDSFYGVVSKDGESFIGEITSDLARETLTV